MARHSFRKKGPLRMRPDTRFRQARSRFDLHPLFVQRTQTEVSFDKLAVNFLTILKFAIIQRYLRILRPSDTP